MEPNDGKNLYKPPDGQHFPVELRPPDHISWSNGAGHFPVLPPPGFGYPPYAAYRPPGAYNPYMQYAPYGPYPFAPHAPAGMHAPFNPYLGVSLHHFGENSYVGGNLNFPHNSQYEYIGHTSQPQQLQPHLEPSHRVGKEEDHYEDQHTETDKREQDASVHVSKEDEKTSFASADKSDRETFSTRDEGLPDFLKGEIVGEEVSFKDVTKETRRISSIANNPITGKYDDKRSRVVGSNEDKDDKAKGNDEATSESDSDSEDARRQGQMLGKSFSTRDIYKYLKSGQYPDLCTSKNKKANLRNQSRSFKIIDGKLFHKCHSGKKTHHGRETSDFPEAVEVIFERKKQMDLIKLVHEGADTSLQAKSLSSHRGMNNVVDILSKRAWWPRMSIDVKEYIRSCDSCQRVNTATLKCKDSLKSIPPPRQNMRQIGIDIIQLPEADGFNYVILGIDYLSKFCDGRALESKSAADVARFLFDWMCMFGMPKIVINDQGREFVNKVSQELFALTGVHQRITSAYNPQANGLVERLNGTAKCGLLKVLQSNVQEWPSILQGVLFAYRTQKQRSTGYSPYYVLFGQEPVLPVDFEIARQDEIDDSDEEEVDNPDECDVSIDKFIENHENEESLALFEEMKGIVEEYTAKKTRVLLKAREKIKVAQNEQKREYDKRNSANPQFKAGQRVLLRNLRRDDRKGGWEELPWTGPYCITQVHENGSCTLKNILTGVTLKTTHRQKNLKLYVYRGKRGEGKSNSHDVQKPTRKRKKRISTTEDSNRDISEVPPKRKKIKRMSIESDSEDEKIKENATEEKQIEKSDSPGIKQIPIMRNGDRGISVDNVIYDVVNTCPFDSLLQLVSVAYSDSLRYQLYLDSRCDIVFYEIVKEIVNKGLSPKVNCDRLRLLLNSPVEVRKFRKKATVNAAGGVSTFLVACMKTEETFLEESSCFSSNCPLVTKPMPTVSFYVPNGSALACLQELVEAELDDSYVPCNRTIKTNEYCESHRIKTRHITGSHIFIEPAQTDENPKKFIHCNTLLSVLPVNITLEEVTYRLRGAVCFIGSDNTSLGHYVAYARRADGAWELYDDLAHEAVKVDPHSTTIKCHLIFYSI